jgi:hypothetical protein
MTTKGPIEFDSRETLVSLLTSPQGWSDATVKDAMHRAALELERLWAQESAVKRIAAHLRDAVGDGM